MDKILQSLANSPAEATLRKAADKVAKKRFDDAVDRLQKDFETSAVTQEIDGGIGADNISGTLRGGGATENLYSFIGFPAGGETNPTEPIRERLDPSHDDGPKLNYVGKDKRRNAIRYQFKVKGPNEDAIWANTKWVWAPRMSWAKKIEGHIQGFSNFLAKHMPNASDAVSRSKGGTQLKKPIRSAEYQSPREGYLQTMFKKFYRRAKGEE